MQRRRKANSNFEKKRGKSWWRHTITEIRFKLLLSTFFIFNCLSILCFHLFFYLSDSFSLSLFCLLFSFSPILSSLCHSFIHSPVHSFSCFSLSLSSFLSPLFTFYLCYWFLSFIHPFYYFHFISSVWLFNYLRFLFHLSNCSLIYNCISVAFFFPLCEFRSKISFNFRENKKKTLLWRHQYQTFRKSTSAKNSSSNLNKLLMRITNWYRRIFC